MVFYEALDIIRRMKGFIVLLISLILSSKLWAEEKTIARQWNESCLEAIRLDFPAPTVHSRNLFHLSACMWDAWSVYEEDAKGVFYEGKHAIPKGYTKLQAQNEAISYASYTLLKHRYKFSTNKKLTLQALDTLMWRLGHREKHQTNEGNSPYAIGNRIAEAVIKHGKKDGANEGNIPGYKNPTGYVARNMALNLETNNTAFQFPTGWNDMNRWQPLAFDYALTQNGQKADNVQRFIGSHWKEVLPLGLERNDKILYVTPANPPLIEDGEAYKQQAIEVLEYSALLDPDLDEVINLSPSARGNNSLGGNDGKGRAINPITNESYATNTVKHADYGRIIAEFWADGPDSETPPGHWNVVANQVTDQLKVEGLEIDGKPVSQLEWEVKLYLSLNAALHNVAIAVWETKAHYDYVRPISAIRYMSKKGQSTSKSLPNYDPQGMMLKDGLVELITKETTAQGERHEHLVSHTGKVAVNVWKGEPENIETQYGGNGWILGETWLPYQKSTFVTPAFAGYTSGHSGFSRAAAEVLTLFTGSEYFPGGMMTHKVKRGDLHYEYGPSEDVELQWATYYDAADEAGISRMYGGIHFAIDDLEGRKIGAEVGKLSYEYVQKYWR